MTRLGGSTGCYNIPDDRIGDPCIIQRNKKTHRKQKSYKTSTICGAGEASKNNQIRREAKKEITQIS